MRASLVLAACLTIVAASIGFANAGDRRASHTGPTESPTTGLGCTLGVWPAFATCKNVYSYKTYSDCHSDAIKLGWRGNDIWWYCSSLGLKG